MKIGLLIRYLALMILVFLGWWLYRYVNPVLVTLIGLLIMGGSTVWLVVAVTRKPGIADKATRSWWRLIWDGFWGL
jgi:hypothetical protein